MKKTIRLTESDLIRLVKRIINEDKSLMKNLGKGLAVTSLVGALSYAFFVSPNKIEITSPDGETRTAEEGEKFTGKVISIRPSGYSKRVTGYVAKLKTSNDEIVEFYFGEPDLQFNVGDRIKVTAGSTFRMFDTGSDVEMD